MSKWQPYNHGRTIGMQSAEGGKVVLDEEHPQGARITLKQGPDFVAVSCLILGKIDHTRFFNEMETAKSEYKTMQKELGNVVDRIASAKSADIKMWEAISVFVKRFP